MLTWKASAPTNIALIKYMGKIDASKNIPYNASLSYTLNYLTSVVELKLMDANEDMWEPLESSYFMNLSETSKTRYINHLKFLKNHFNANKFYFRIRSQNNFPLDCGLASSASSFAALTKAACKALTELTQSATPTQVEQSVLSQQGSGSSCRSFFEPWCIWDENAAKSVDIPYKNLWHQVIVVSKAKKLISSTHAHQLVQTSLLYQDRARRANYRCQELITAFTQQNWQLAYELIWQDFWDMHTLFETAHPPLGYMTPASLQVINYIREYWQQHQDGPLITLDAGPNVHLLYREEQLNQAQQIAACLSEFLILKNY